MMTLKTMTQINNNKQQRLLLLLIFKSAGGLSGVPGFASAITLEDGIAGVR
jgi:hypothetical protein